jgi:type IV pilus assembly protein PilW
MRRWFDCTRYLEVGFSLIELLVAIAVAGLLLTAFTGFYLSQQRATRHHQVEIEASLALRTALEQISRDVRSARKDLTRDPTDPVTHPGAGAAILTADATHLEFTLDVDDEGAITSTDPREHKGFTYDAAAGTIEVLDATTGNWNTLADNVSAFSFSYFDCAQAATAVLDAIASVGVSITVTRPVIAGLPVSRTETETIRLRNKSC